MSKLIAIAALSTAGALTGLGGTADVAGAASATGTIKGFATTYTSPSNESAPVHHLQERAPRSTPSASGRVKC